MILRFLRAIPDGVVSCLMNGSTNEKTKLTKKMQETLSTAYNQGEGEKGAIVNKLDKKKYDFPGINSQNNFPNSNMNPSKLTNLKP